MNALVRIDVSSPTPQYEQVRAQIAALIAAGALGEGDRLPTVRVLASDLGIAPGTIARAYSELEAAGLVASRRRVGTVVTAQRPTSSAPGAAAAQLAEVARAHGLTDSETHDLLAAALIRHASPSVAR